MNYCRKIRCKLSLLALFFVCASLFGGTAFGAATAPVVTPLASISKGIVTPTRLAQQSSSGNIYLTDPHAEGILIFSPAGDPVGKIFTAKEPGGIAFAKNGDVLVTQGTYVVVLNSLGNEVTRFGSFLSAVSIAVDNDAAGTGMIFVSDSADNCVQVFDAAYNARTVTGEIHAAGKPVNSFGDKQPSTTAVLGRFNRPSAIAYEKNNKRLIVADSLNGKLQIFNVATIINNTGSVVNNVDVTVLGGPTVGYNTTALIKFTYPQGIALEYDAGGLLNRVYVLDTHQSYIMVLDGTVFPYTKLLDGLGVHVTIGDYGYSDHQLIVPSDIIADTKDPKNNRLLVANGSGSLRVFGLSSIQPYDVTVGSPTDNSLTLNWLNPAQSLFKAIRVYRSEVEGTLGTPVGLDLPNTATTLTDNGLLQYKTYYYTVRAIDNADVPTTNTIQASGKTTGTFGLTLHVAGSGTINGGSTCSGANCGPFFKPSDKEVTLVATESVNNTFSGWTGDCFTTSYTCNLPMDINKAWDVVATFVAKKAFRVDGAYFDNLQDAYNAARHGSVIKVLAGTWPSTALTTEYMTAWQAKSVSIEGGYEATFTNNAGGSSTATGRANLSGGKVVMKQFRLK